MSVFDYLHAFKSFFPVPGIFNFRPVVTSTARTRCDYEERTRIRRVGRIAIVGQREIDVADSLRSRGGVREIHDENIYAIIYRNKRRRGPGSRWDT